MAGPLDHAGAWMACALEPVMNMRTAAPWPSPVLCLPRWSLRWLQFCVLRGGERSLCCALGVWVLGGRRELDGIVSSLKAACAGPVGGGKSSVRTVHSLRDAVQVFAKRTLYRFAVFANNLAGV